MRTASASRITKETSIEVSIQLDGSGKCDVDTGIGFFDHMLHLFAFHANMDVTLKAKGDLHVCDHHTIEDCAILLGSLFKEALQDKVGIARYGSARVIMDECLTSVDVDICNRSYLVFNCDFKRDSIHTYSTEMTKEFFQAFAYNANVSLHINNQYGENDHHKVESIFKGVARALKQAIVIESNQILSSKGVL